MGKDVSADICHRNCMEVYFNHGLKLRSACGADLEKAHVWVSGGVVEWA